MNYNYIMIHYVSSLKVYVFHIHQLFETHLTDIKNEFFV